MFASRSATSRLDGVTYERLVATDHTFERTELFDGVSAEKPSMSWFHDDLGGELGFVIRSHLGPDRCRLRSNHARLALPEGSYSIPDIAIVPNTPPDAPGDLDPYRQLVPLVVENRSSLGRGYVASIWLPGDHLGGDAEVWSLTVPARPDSLGPSPPGGYDEGTLQGRVVESVALPDVRIAPDALLGV